MNYAIIFLSISILLLSCMLVIYINIEIEPIKNRVFVVIKVFNIKVLTIKISLIGLYYQINNSKKLKSFNIFLNKEQEYLFLQIKNSIIDKLYYDDIVFKSYIGFNNANATALTIGGLNLFCMMLSNKLMQMNKDTRLYFSNLYNFSDFELRFNINFKVYFTIFDLIFAIITSFYRRNKYVKERNKVK